MSSEIAWRAASFTSGDAGKSGNPCAILTASYCMARRVISRITDSVNRSALADSVRCTAAATFRETGMNASPASDKLEGALNGFLPPLRDAVHSSRQGRRPLFSRSLSANGESEADLQQGMECI